MRTKLSIGDIRASYTEERKESDKRDSILLYYILRPLSFYPTWLFVQLGISANKVTIIGIIIMLIGCILLSTGAHTAIIVGAVLLNIYKLLDSVDGNVARFTRKYGGYLGNFLEILEDILDKGFVYFCAGIGAFLNPGWLPVALPGYTFLLLGGLTAIFFLMTGSIYLFLASEVLRRGGGFAPVRSMIDRTWIIRLAWHVLGAGVWALILLILAIINCLGLFVIFHTLIAIGFFSTTLFGAILGRHTAKQL